MSISLETFMYVPSLAGCVACQRFVRSFFAQPLWVWRMRAMRGPVQLTDPPEVERLLYEEGGDHPPCPSFRQIDRSSRRNLCRCPMARLQVENGSSYRPSAFFGNQQEIKAAIKRRLPIREICRQRMDRNLPPKCPLLSWDTYLPVQWRGPSLVQRSGCLAVCL